MVILAAVALVALFQVFAGTDPLSWALGLSQSNQTLANAHDSSSDRQASLPHERGASGHEASEGLVLQSISQVDSVYQGGRCDAKAVVRSFNVVAIAVDITLNRYLDHDPKGLAYVLESDLDRVLQEENQNTLARTQNVEPAVTVGLQGDAIQPIVLRVNQGECLHITLRNDLTDQPASLHLHGSSLHMLDTGAPAIATNPESTALPGQTVRYEWMVSDDEQEGARYFHSHGDDRFQTSHGLFGAVIVEPKGSLHLAPMSGDELSSGWSAIIRHPAGTDFREFVLVYHEIGDENYQLLNKDGAFVPQVDPFTGAYRPAARALNYRSEPFMNRLALQQAATGFVDESVAYSSYVFGDPATPIMRSYLGDPVKERVIHGGSEVSHVHHVHGGSIRWRRQPGVEPSDFNRGLDKHPALLPEASERIDSQSIGPSETFDVENECGSGGCQQSAGDFLVHCHVAHHYFAGMWGLWRVYNTMQDGVASTDALPPLKELPDNPGNVEPAVTSDQLAGRTVDWSGKTFEIDRSSLDQWVERQLPPQGLPRGYDASVMDWRKDGDRYLNEEETTHSWPGYAPSMPGSRSSLLFDPRTGKLAYPMLRPHLAKRPPFAPNHGPSPFLDPITDGVNVPQPGDNGPASICPAGTDTQEFVIHAITVPVTLNKKNNIVDPSGELFVLKSEEDAVRENNEMRTPLAIRANAGEDCVDILLKNELQNNDQSRHLRKVNAHIHFVQFDVQASDGVIAGFNYEQSVLPFTTEGEKLRTAAVAGEQALELTSAQRFQPGILVGVGMDQADTFEIKRISEIRGDALVFTEPLRYDHGAGEIVSAEFVRYRWYPDVQFGAAYFHDHVNALESWRHGLYGAFVSEPPGSSYHNPQTGQTVRSGPIADIHTDSKVSVDVAGSFREMVLFIHDESPPTHVGRSSGSLFNLRAEPLDKRPGDPAQRFSSAKHGDPETPILSAYLGDPVVVRALVGATNDVHTLHVDGHWFRIEPYSAMSPPVNTVRIGISERYDLVIPRAGGPQNLPGDYLYYNGRTFKLREGSWGLLRVLDGQGDTSLHPLPGRQVPQASSSICPSDAPQKHYDVSAIDAPLPMLGGAMGKMYVLQDDKEAVLIGTRPPEPLVLRVNVGDCITVDLTNDTQGGSVSFHTDMLAYDPRDSYGIEAGLNPPQAVAPGETRRYTFYAHPEVGETVSLVRDWGDVTKNPGLGLYGAIVVGPPGAAYRHPVTGEDLSTESSWQADVYPLSSKPYRDFALFFQDEDDTIGTHRMPYTTHVQGAVGVNYGSEPLGDRRGRDSPTAFQDLDLASMKTPVMRAYVGDAVKVHVLVPWSEQAQVFSIEGHSWPFEPGRHGTTMLSSTLIGGIEALTLSLDSGAGGKDGLPGDYIYGDHRLPYQDAGLWGIFQVLPADASYSDLLVLGCRNADCSNRQWLPIAIVSFALVSVLLASGLGYMKFRSRRRKLSDQ